MADNINTTDILRCLDQEQGRVFSLVFVSYDRKRKTGGKLRRIDRCISVNAGRHAGGIEKRRSKTPTLKPKKYLNYTRKISPVDERGREIGHIITIHPELILFFDGKKHLLS